MQPVEALRTTIDLARQRLDQDIWEEGAPQVEAVGICESFLDAATAPPIARFHCYVSIENIGQKSKLGLGDFTVSGLTIPSIKNGLIGLSMEKVTVYVRLWERMQESSDMLSGYQGDTKTLGFRNWLKSLDQWEAERTRPMLEVGNGPQG